MKRRNFLKSVLGGVLVPVVVKAQPVPVVGELKEYPKNRPVEDVGLLVGGTTGPYVLKDYNGAE